MNMNPIRLWMCDNQYKAVILNFLLKEKNVQRKPIHSLLSPINTPLFMSSSSTATTPYTQSQLKSLYNISGLICQNLDQTLHMLLTEHDVDVVTEAKKAFNLNTRILGYDVVFIFKEQDLGYQYCIAHRQILSEACNYFANLLGMTKEWQHQACSELPMVVHIENISWKVFQLILEYIYTNNLESLQKEHVLEILTAVDMISFQKM
jgi:hypothetical protein